MATIRCATVIAVRYAADNHLARFKRLLYVGSAATEESIMTIGMQSAAGCSAALHNRQPTASCYAPDPGGEMNARAPSVRCEPTAS